MIIETILGSRPLQDRGIQLVMTTWNEDVLLYISQYYGIMGLHNFGVVVNSHEERKEIEIFFKDILDLDVYLIWRE